MLLAGLFSFAGEQIGSRIVAEKLRECMIRILFAILLLLFSAKLFQRAW